MCYVPATWKTDIRNLLTVAEIISMPILSLGRHFIPGEFA